MEPITDEDVRALLPDVPHIDSSLIDQDSNSVRNLLVIFGVKSRQQLSEFVKSSEIFDYLAKVYVDELGRPEAKPLDPTAVAVWGAILFTRGLRDDVKSEIMKKIRQSDEYVQKHRKVS